MDNKINGLNLSISENIITVAVTKDSNLIMVYISIKFLINFNKILPVSLYSVFNIDGCVVKKKQSINKFRYIDVWKFLDFHEMVDDKLDPDYSSENLSIDGWEVRYHISPSSEQISEIFSGIRDGYEGLKKIISYDDQ